MSGVCETWSLDELVQMTEEDMDSVLSFYELRGLVLSHEHFVLLLEMHSCCIDKIKYFLVCFLILVSAKHGASMSLYR
jgi:hypothetical protein